MVTEIKHKRNGAILSFLPNGIITGQDGNNAIGNWTSIPPNGAPVGVRNQFFASLLDGSSFSVPVRYQFVTDPENGLENLLSVSIDPEHNDGHASEPCLLPGRIVVDDASDVIYEILNDDRGRDAREIGSITVHGSLSFSKTYESLVLTLDGGLQTEIVGENPEERNFDAESINNALAEFRDRFRFRAQTRYRIDGEPSEPRRAEIGIIGRYDFNKDGRLVFQAAAQLADGKPKVELLFAGAYKAISAGLSIKLDGTTFDAEFVIAGTLANTGGEWTIALGTKKNVVTLAADLNTGVIPIGDTGTLRITGSARVESAPENTAFRVEITAIAKINRRGILEVRTSVEGSTAGGYTLVLAGSYKTDASAVTFSVSYNSGTRQFTLDFAHTTEHYRFFAKAVKDKSGASIEVGLSVALVFTDHGLELRNA